MRPALIEIRTALAVLSLQGETTIAHVCADQPIRPAASEALARP